MMEQLISSIVLGIVQGVTEFLPVSSSGHLELTQYLLSDPNLASELDGIWMSVVLHTATAISTLIVFRQDVMTILRKAIQNPRGEDGVFCAKILISMIPAVLVGLLFEEQLNSLFEGRILLVGCMLAVTGVLLLLADRAQTTEQGVTWLNAVWVGIAQAVAILPGISRSGATISTCVLLGIDRSRASRFSFLMVVPLIFGKMAKDILDWLRSDDPASLSPPPELWPMLAGFVAALITGVLACTWMLKLVRSAKLSYFSIYCFVVAAVAIFEGLRIHWAAEPATAWIWLGHG